MTNRPGVKRDGHLVSSVSQLDELRKKAYTPKYIASPVRGLPVGRHS